MSSEGSRVFNTISATILFLCVAQYGLAAGQQPQKEAVAQTLPLGAVTVFHSVDVDKLIRLVKQEKGAASIGVWMPPGRNPISITTGLVVDESGHIITRLVNLDPEDKNQDLIVRTSDGVQLKATLVGVDCATGFAVLQVAPNSRVVPATTAGPVDEGIPVKLFSSDLGQKATLSGDVIRFSPQVAALDGKITAGTLFSRARGALTLESIGLGPKNDSGVVETLDMKVVGMAQSGLSAGTAYVFPYEFLRGQVLARVLDRNGTVAAGWLGVVTDTPAAGRGAVIKEIQPQSTAEACGLQARDVIVGLDDYDIAGQAEMAAVLSALPAGRKVRLRALRNQKPMELEAVLGAQPIRPILTGVPTIPATHSNTEERLPPGFIARDLTSQLADYFGVKGGMLITEVSKGSPADRAGLVAGDVVVGTDDRDLRTVLELKTLLLTPQRGAIKLRIYRNKTSFSVDILDPISPEAK